MQNIKITLLIIIIFTWTTSPFYAEPLNPADAGKYFIEANQCLMKGDTDGAITNYNEAIKYNPNIFEYHFGLGFAYHSKGDLDNAIKEYRLAAKLNSNNAELYYNLGTALLTKGDRKSAIGEFKKAIKLNPKYTNSYINIGDALVKEGNVNEALKYYQTAQKIAPGDKQITENIKIVKEIQKQPTPKPIPTPVKTPTPKPSPVKIPVPTPKPTLKIVIKPTPTPVVPIKLPKATPTPSLKIKPIIIPSETPSLEPIIKPILIPSSTPTPVEITYQPSPTPIIMEILTPFPTTVSLWSSPWVPTGFSLVLPGAGQVYNGDTFSIIRGIVYASATGICYWQALESANKGEDPTSRIIWLGGIGLLTILAPVDAYFTNVNKN